MKEYDNINLNLEKENKSLKIAIQEYKNKAKSHWGAYLRLKNAIMNRDVINLTGNDDDAVVYYPRNPRGNRAKHVRENLKQITKLHDINPKYETKDIMNYLNIIRDDKYLTIKFLFDKYHLIPKKDIGDIKIKDNYFIIQIGNDVNKILSKIIEIDIFKIEDFI